MTISGQFKPQSGAVYFKDYDIYENNLRFKKNIGFVHENPFFYPYLTTQEFLQFIADIKGRSQEEANHQIPELLKTVNMWAERDKLTSNLSQGMKKKLAVAAAMIGSPRMIFLDEALNGVDFESAFGIKKALAGYVKNGGVVILSTHVLEVVEKICDRYLVLKQGKIIADLQAEEINNLAGGGLEKYIIEMLNK